MRFAKILLATVGLLLSFVHPTQAGMFQLRGIWYDGWMELAYELVIVNAYAEYVGTPDANDVNWLIQTFLNDSWGGDIGDWDHPDWSGAGLNGSGVHTGMVIVCVGGCTANGEVQRPVCGNATAAYRGKAGVTIYHQFNPDIDIDFGTIEVVPCAPAPPDPPGRCDESLVGSTTVTLTGAGGPILADRQLGFGLGRFEQRPEGHIILDEWAVLSFAGDKPAVEFASTTEFKERVEAASDAFRATARQTSKVLVVAHADHPHNSRHIPLPTLQPIDAEVKLRDGTVGRDYWFRAEVGRSGQVDRLRLLEDSDHIELHGAELHRIESALRRNLKLRYADDGRHRAVVFGAARIVGNGRLAAIMTPLVILPRCCCGGFHCY